MGDLRNLVRPSGRRQQPAAAGGEPQGLAGRAATTAPTGGDRLATGAAAGSAECRRLAAAPQPPIGRSMKSGATSQGSQTGVRGAGSTGIGRLLEACATGTGYLVRRWVLEARAAGTGYWESRRVAGRVVRHGVTDLQACRTYDRDGPASARQEQMAEAGIEPARRSLSSGF